MNKRNLGNVLVSALLATFAPGCLGTAESGTDEEGTQDNSIGNQDVVVSDTLSPGQSLSAGQSLVAASGAKATMQTNGDFVLYDSAGNKVWESSTFAITVSAVKVTMQMDGNFVISGKPISIPQPWGPPLTFPSVLWTSGTGGQPAGSSSLKLESTLSLVLYGQHGMLWTSSEDVSLVQKFAPRLRFDGAAPGYPMSADQFYKGAVVTPQHAGEILQNTDYSLIQQSKVPTYYQVITCGSQTRIKYWTFYGYQPACDAFGNGEHNGDWEEVMVTLSEDKSRIAAVTYWAHGQHYTRLTAGGGVAIEEGTHPVVFAGKVTHASYYNQGGLGTCGYWDDFRNNFDGSHMDTWSNVVSLAVGTESWMAPDRMGNFSWGWDGVNTHPTTDPPTCSENACDWGTLWGAGGAMGHTQCKDGDDDTGVQCLKRCRPGYTNGGLICTNWSTLDSYARTLYDYDYSIPTTDVGLLSYSY